MTPYMYRAQAYAGDLMRALADADDEVCTLLCRVPLERGTLYEQRRNIGTMLHFAVSVNDGLLVLSLLKGMMLLKDSTMIKMRDARGNNFLEFAMSLGRGEILRYSTKLLGPDVIKILLSTL